MHALRLALRAALCRTALRRAALALVALALVVAPVALASEVALRPVAMVTAAVATPAVAPVAMATAAVATSAPSSAFDAVAGAPAAEPAEPRPFVRGIYLQQGTLQTPKRLAYLIQNAKRAGLTTFVVDLWIETRHFARGAERLKQAGIELVPRIVLFPDGGNQKQVRDPAYWEERWAFVDYALSLGVQRIQLDYVRYSSRTEPSPENATDVARVVKFFGDRIRERGARLEIDVFGEVAFRTSTRIGQDIGLLAPEIDAVCPMVYPSHYEPFEEHSSKPFDTVYDSLVALQSRMGEHAVPVHAYIEMFNYRVPMSRAERADYLEAQLDAVDKSNAEGWYVWSASNRYDVLFQTLARRVKRAPDETR